jgi:multicomponent Na+:H+ antiporter subunit D
MTALLPISVILPLLGAGLAVMVRGLPAAARTISIGTLCAQLASEVAMLIGVDRGGTIVMHLGGWSAPVGITLVADRFASILMVISTVVTLAVLVYAVSQRRDTERPDGSAAAFHPAMLLMAAGVSNAFVSGDLFNLFVSFEILLTASYALLTLGGTTERVRAGAPYLVVSLLSSIIFLAAIAMTYAATGTVNLADLALRMGDLSPGAANVLQALLLVAFGIKAAVWPMSAWLPDSYPNAPAPVTAVFAGLLTKVGIYAIVRTQTVLFAGRGFDSLLMWAALATMIIGILGAVAQHDIKRLLSFTLVSHIGYLLFGVAIGTSAGLAATVFYVVHHILVQTALFLAAGLIEQLRGTTDVARLGGLARSAPALAVLFFVPAMNLAGVPPLSGFLGKIGLFQAGFAIGGGLAVAVIAAGTLTSLLTLYAIVRVWGRAFWRPTPTEGVHEIVSAATDSDVSGSSMTTPSGRARSFIDARFVEPIPPGMPTVALPKGFQRRQVPLVRLPRGMMGATAAVVAAGCLLTVAGGPIYALAARTGGDLARPDSYITAVVGPR